MVERPLLKISRTIVGNNRPKPEGGQNLGSFSTYRQGSDCGDNERRVYPQAAGFNKNGVTLSHRHVCVNRVTAHDEGGIDPKEIASKAQTY